METILSLSGCAVAWAHESRIFRTGPPRVDCGIRTIERIGVSIDRTEWTHSLEGETFRLSDPMEGPLGIDRNPIYERGTAASLFDENETFRVSDVAGDLHGIDRGLLHSDDKRVSLVADDETLRVGDPPEEPPGINCCNLLSKSITTGSIVGDDETLRLGNLAEGSPGIDSGWLYGDAKKGFHTVDDDNFHVGGLTEEGAGVDSNLLIEGPKVGSVAEDKNVTRFNELTEGSPDVGSDPLFNEGRTDPVGAENVGFRFSNLPEESPDLGPDLICNDAPASSLCVDNGTVRFDNQAEGPLGIDRGLLKGGIAATSSATENRIFLGDLEENSLGVDQDVLSGGVATGSIVNDGETMRIDDLTGEAAGVEENPALGDLTAGPLTDGDGVVHADTLTEEVHGIKQDLVGSDVRSESYSTGGDTLRFCEEITGVDRNLPNGSVKMGFLVDENGLFGADNLSTGSPVVGNEDTSLNSLASTVSVTEHDLFDFDQPTMRAEAFVDPVNSLLDFKAAPVESMGIHANLTQSGCVARGFRNANIATHSNNSSSSRKTVKTRPSSVRNNEAVSISECLQEWIKFIYYIKKEWYRMGILGKIGFLVTILGLPPTLAFYKPFIIDAKRGIGFSVTSSQFQPEERVEKLSQPRPPSDATGTSTAPISKIHSETSSMVLLQPDTSSADFRSDSGDEAK